MSISPRTVEMNLTLTMLRLKARNRTHLITQAVIDGVLRIRDTAAAVALCFVLALVTNGHIADSDHSTFARRTTRSVRRKDDSAPTLLHDFD
jgi:hypothetical protein